MEVLGHAECLRLLWSHHVGRVGLVDEGEPHIFPVIYGLHEGNVVFRSAVGAKLDAALRRSPVAFEVDGWDESVHVGWSVLVLGSAMQVEDPAIETSLDELGLPIWVHGPHEMRWIAILPNEVSGRRISGPPAADMD
jgi:nitroimidazol reductase NimA-like FMN-containing flavoprotein (pyridoxamine 5'-phosphate oxidase superfamily)